MDTATDQPHAQLRVIDLGDISLPLHPWIQPVWLAQLKLQYATRLDAWLTPDIALQMQAHHLVLAWRPHAHGKLELLGGFRNFLLLSLATVTQRNTLHILDYSDQLTDSQALKISLDSTLWPILANALRDSRAEWMLKDLLGDVRKALPPEAQPYLPNKSNLRNWFTEHSHAPRPTPATPSRLETTLRRISTTGRRSEEEEG